MGPLTDGDYGNNYSNTIYGNVSPNIVGFGNVSSSSSSSPFSSVPALNLGGIGGLVSAVINPVLQAVQNSRNRQFAKEQALLENRLNYEQWMRENAYNTPSAQMQRYIQAGLNPNLLVGGHQNLSASSPQMTSAKDASAGIAPMLDPSQLLVGAQVRNLDASTDQMRKSLELTDAEVRHILGDTPFDKAEIARINAVTKSLVRDYNINAVNELIAGEKIKYLNDTEEAVVTVVGADGEKIQYREKVGNLKSLVAADFRTVFNDRHLAEAMASLYIAQALNTQLYTPDLLESQTRYINNLAAKTGYEAKDLQSFLNYADQYYKSLSDEAEALSSMTQTDRDFYESFGGRALFNAVSGAAGKVIDFVGKIARPTKSLTINNVR